MLDRYSFYLTLITSILGLSLPMGGPVMASGGSAAADVATIPQLYTYQIINTYPHDPDAFTQGFVYDQGFLYESTGLHGRSTLRKVDLKTGRVLKTYRLPARFFGEGLTLLDNRIIQLTWKSRLAFIYDKESFELRQQFRYPMEGWGITHDGKHLIISDGTPILRYFDPITFEQVRQIEVHDDKGPVSNVNELEYINGEIYANVWQIDRIAIIDPGSGQVTGWALLDGLLGAPYLTRPVDVLNGIAYDDVNDRLFVGGKLWPVLFEIKLVPVTP